MASDWIYFSETLKRSGNSFIFFNEPKRLQNSLGTKEEVKGCKSNVTFTTRCVHDTISIILLAKTNTVLKFRNKLTNLNLHLETRTNSTREQLSNNHLSYSLLTQRANVQLKHNLA